MNGYLIHPVIVDFVEFHILECLGVLPLFERASTPDPESRNQMRGEGTPAKVTWDPRHPRGT